uniref:Serpin domain-containing protein n=1 Tax=Microcebus murinus TaxID=30608 RepID=A0A8C5XC26_MICMU
MKSLSEANTQFALDMFRQFGKSKEDNIFYSPFSITSAFGMLLLGCRENTALQIEKVLHFNQLTENAKQRTAACHQYLDNVKEFYLASAESVDFQNATEESEKKINTWVETQTNLEDKLTAEKLIEWTSSQNMSKRGVDLYLPRFKVEKSYDLKDVLMAMGMVDVFSPQDADLSGMTGSRGLVVTKVLHKAFVEVTEEGTEAAAATGIVISKTSTPYSIYEEFHCNHPFLFFIKQNKTNN